MVSQGYALARAELLRSLVARTGVTTADGAGTFDTLVDSALIGVDPRKIVEKTILISSGNADGEDAASVSFVGDTITISPPFSSQILAGTIYRIVNISTVELDVINILARIGQTGAAAGTATLFAWLAKLWGSLGGGPSLVYGGVVTAAVPGASFTIDSLKGLGAGKFASTTQPPYRAYVLRDASGGVGGAPEGEMAAITGYTTASGLFTPNGPPVFSVDIAVDDEVLILHPRLAEIKDLIDRLGAFTSTENLKAILGAYTAAAPLKASMNRQLFSMDFWSVPQISVVVPAGAANKPLPDVVVAGLPGGMTVVKATAMFKFRMLDNVGAANALNGDQHIGIQKGGGGGYDPAISLVADQFGIGAATREGGDVVVGDHNVVAKVNGDATYNFLWLLANADVANLTFNDVQMGLRIWYSV